MSPAARVPSQPAPAPVAAPQARATSAGVGGRADAPEQRELLALSRSAGNGVVAQFVRGTIAPPRPLQRRPVQRDDKLDPELQAKEDAALAKAAGLVGKAAGSFHHGNPMSPRHRPPNSPPIGGLVLGAVRERAKSATQLRATFDAAAAAQAWATVAKGPAGAAVVKVDSMYVVLELSAAIGANFQRDRIWSFNPLSGVSSAVSSDGYVFTAGSYTPDEDAASLRDRPEEDLATAASAESLREMAGIPEEGLKPGEPGATAGKSTKIPAGTEKAFLQAYLVARASEALLANREQATKLAEQMKPGEDGQRTPEANQLIADSRDNAHVMQALLDAETAFGEKAADVQEAHEAVGGNRKITIKGVRKPYFDWVDELNGSFAAIQKGKQDTLAMSPILASLVEFPPTPRLFKDAAAKARWNRSTIKQGIDIVKWVSPVGWLAMAYDKASSPSNTLDKSELRKDASKAGDDKVADEFRTKLDAVQRAISKTYAQVASGDVGFLLGLSGLRSRIDGDLARIDPTNLELKQAWKEMCTSQELQDLGIEVMGTIVQMGALFLPGGQFISAAIGLGMQMKTTSDHLKQWDASKAAVNPAAALADQQAVAKMLLFDTLNLALGAVDMAASVKAGMGPGRTPKEMLDDAGVGEAADPSKKLPGKENAPETPLPNLPKDKNGVEAWEGLSEGFRKDLEAKGIKGNPLHTKFDEPGLVRKEGSWEKIKAFFKRTKEDKLAGEYALYKLSLWREMETASVLEEVMEILRKDKVDADGKVIAVGAPHSYEAVGSAGLTSDLDWSIVGPRSAEGVELFNTKLRQRLGREPGTALDSNAYTRSAALDYPLVAVVDQKTGKLLSPTISMTGSSGGKKAWKQFEATTLAGAKDSAESARLKAVLSDASRRFPDDFRGRIRYVDNFRQASASQVAAYEACMAKGFPEGPAAWKAYRERALDGVDPSQRALASAELDQAATIGARKEEKVLEELNKHLKPDDPNRWTPETLHTAMHSDPNKTDFALSDAVMRARNNVYAKELATLDELKKAHATPGLSEAEKLEIAARINAQQTEALGYAAEAYVTGGSLLSVVQNAQKAKGNMAHPAFGQMVANQARAAFNEQIGNMMGHAGASWPNAVKFEKYLLRAEEALVNHPFAKVVKRIPPDLRNALAELKKIKEKAVDSVELKDWANKHYGTSDVDAALGKLSRACDAEGRALQKQMNGLAGLPESVQVLLWEQVASDPAKVQLLMAKIAALNAIN